MSNLVKNAEFVLIEARKKAIAAFEKNVKGEFVTLTESGIKIKIHDKKDDRYIYCQVIQRGSSIKFENLNNAVALTFNNVSKDNAKYAAVYFNQIKAIQYSISLVKKLNEDDLVKQLKEIE